MGDSKIGFCFGSPYSKGLETLGFKSETPTYGNPQVVFEVRNAAQLELQDPKQCTVDTKNPA